MKTYPRTVDDEHVVHNPLQGQFFSQPYFEENFEALGTVTEAEPRSIIVKVPLPPRSLLVMYGSSRYEWEHAIQREDITGRRAIIAYRELTPTYLPQGEQQEIGREILTEAAKFWDDKLELENGKDREDDKIEIEQSEMIPSSVA